MSDTTPTPAPLAPAPLALTGGVVLGDIPRTLDRTLLPKRILEVLDTIDNFLTNASRNDAVTLWDLLSAIRGPDVPDSQELKRRTTAAIRAALFPSILRSGLGDRANRVGAEVAPVSQFYLPIYDYESDTFHFVHHIQRAAHKLLSHEI